MIQYKLSKHGPNKTKEWPKYGSNHWILDDLAGVSSENFYHLTLLKMRFTEYFTSVSNYDMG